MEAHTLPRKPWAWISSTQVSARVSQKVRCAEERFSKMSRNKRTNLPQVEIPEGNPDSRIPPALRLLRLRRPPAACRFGDGPFLCVLRPRSDLPSVFLAAGAVHGPVRETRPDLREPRQDETLREQRIGLCAAAVFPVAVTGSAQAGKVDPPNSPLGLLSGGLPEIWARS